MKKTHILFVAFAFIPRFGDEGDFDASVHQEFLLKAEEKWDDGKYKDDLMANVDVGVQVLNGQTARFEELDDPKKDNKVNLTWIIPCGIETSEFDREADSCEIDPVEVETGAEEYEMTLLQKTGFKIDEEKLRTNIYTKEELVATNLLRCDKQLSEWWCKQIMLFLKANAGANIPAIDGVVPPFTWNEGAQTTNIGAGAYGIGIIASLMKQMLLNKLGNAMFVNNGSLYEPWTNAMLNAGNLDGKGDDLRLKQVDMTFDMWNFAAAGLTEDMFMINKNSIAMKTYTRFDEVPVYKGGKIQQTRYKMPSRLLPGVWYDVRYTQECTGGHDFEKFQVETQGGIWVNPVACPILAGGVERTPSGIYSFTKTA